MPEPTTPPTTEEVKAAIAATTKAGDWPGEFKLADGSVVKAANWEEAFKTVADMKANTAAALRDREEQVRQRQQELDELQRAGRSMPMPDPSTGFDEKKYWELANQDPRLATRYALAADLGIENPDHLPLLFSEMRNVATLSADNIEINTFMQRNPDWPGNDTDADLIIQRLAEQNKPLTADNLEYEYLKSVRNGEIEPLGEEAVAPYAPPSLGGTGLSREDANLLQQAQSIPDDKLDEFYRRIGMLK
jgi:hypothetical protein